MDGTVVYVEGMPISLFRLLHTVDPDLVPTKCKLHFATPNGGDSPLKHYLAGDFEPWQAQQSQRNFERPFVVSLIQMGPSHRWLFAGAYDAGGSTPSGKGVAYRLTCRSMPELFAGRIVVDFDRPFRASYPKGETCADQLLVHELRSEVLSVEAFPGFRNVHIDRDRLDLIARTKPASWVAALSSVGGVYLISDDTEGKLYVGSAVGGRGFWGRWEEYAHTRHGGNKLLRGLLEEHGQERCRAFRYSILETADLDMSRDDVVARESRWKRVLGTRAHGLNGN